MDKANKVLKVILGIFALLIAFKVMKMILALVLALFLPIFMGAGVLFLPLIFLLLLIGGFVGVIYL